MAAANDTVPWHRVINAQGKISPRGDGGGEVRQRARLEDEGIHFDGDGKTNLRLVRWLGPSIEWKIENGFDPAPTWREK
jgi:methylated-DNA-protein-cysteine methyltransferase-like protein